MCVILRIKKPTPSIQGMDKAIKAFDERLKKLENMMKLSREENDDEMERITNDREDR